jgi:hypothetical protein
MSLLLLALLGATPSLTLTFTGLEEVQSKAWPTPSDAGLNKMEGPDAPVDREIDDPHFGHVKTTSWTIKTAMGSVWNVVTLHLSKKSPRTLKRYVMHWRSQHGCTAEELPDIPLLEANGQTPEQVTFGGVCKGGDAFQIRVVLLRNQAFELHAYTERMGQGRADLSELLKHVSLQ